MYRWSIELEGIFVLPLAPRWVRHSYLSKEATIDPLYLWVINDVHVDAQPSNNNDVEIEPAVDLDNPQSKNQRYDKRDFVARKHGKEREPWVQKPMPFPPKPSKKKDDEDFERFAEMIRPIFLRM